MKNRTEKNIETLAREAVDHMDMGTLCEFAQEHLEEYYSKLPREEFNKEWNLVFGK